jgi:hypothetical protein
MRKAAMSETSMRRMRTPAARMAGGLRKEALRGTLDAVGTRGAAGSPDSIGTLDGTLDAAENLKDAQAVGVAGTTASRTRQVRWRVRRDEYDGEKDATCMTVGSFVIWLAQLSE